MKIYVRQSKFDKNHSFGAVYVSFGHYIEQNTFRGCAIDSKQEWEEFQRVTSKYLESNFSNLYF